MVVDYQKYKQAWVWYLSIQYFFSFRYNGGLNWHGYMKVMQKGQYLTRRFWSLQVEEVHDLCSFAKNLTSGNWTSSELNAVFGLANTCHMINLSSSGWLTLLT